MSTIIEHHLELNVPDGNRGKEKIIQYFTGSGFKFISPNNHQLVFKRGSETSNMWTFSPLKWKSEIRIEIDGQQVKACFEIDTIWQIVSPPDEEQWIAFIENFRLYLMEGIDFKAVNARTSRNTLKKNMKYIGWAVLGGVLGAFPGAIVFALTGVKALAPLGGAIGALGLLQRKINEDRAKNDPGRISS